MLRRKCEMMPEALHHSKMRKFKKPFFSLYFDKFLWRGTSVISSILRRSIERVSPFNGAELYGEVQNSTSVSEDDLNCVVEKIADSKKSLEKYTATILYCNNCRLHIVESDESAMHFRHSQRSCPGSNKKKIYVKKSLVLAQDALELAKPNNFQEIMRYCNSRIGPLQIILDGLIVSVNEDEE